MFLKPYWYLIQEDCTRNTHVAAAVVQSCSIMGEYSTCIIAGVEIEEKHGFDGIEALCTDKCSKHITQLCSTEHGLHKTLFMTKEWNCDWRYS